MRHRHRDRRARSAGTSTTSYTNNEEYGEIDQDWAIRYQILGVGPEFEFEVISQENWMGRRMVADKMRGERVFIAGDACHLWIPAAGYGMNTGIADAADLAWFSLP